MKLELVHGGLNPYSNGMMIDPVVLTHIQATSQSLNLYSNGMMIEHRMWKPGQLVTLKS